MYITCPVIHYTNLCREIMVLLTQEEISVCGLLGNRLYYYTLLSVCLITHVHSGLTLRIVHINYRYLITVSSVICILLVSNSSYQPPLLDNGFVCYLQIARFE
jgi:hypothetical protein